MTSEPSLPELKIAVFGVINAGKSSLINALTRSEIRATSPVGGTTREVAAVSWAGGDASDRHLPFAPRLIDTPGIEEVGDVQLAQAATSAARAADLVLFVIAEDLTDSARAALFALHAFGKPMIVALNKVDLLDEAEVENILDSVRKRLEGVVPTADVIPIAAAPVVRERIKQADGTTRYEVRHGSPRIASLEARLIGVLLESAEDLRALNEAGRSVEALLAHRDELKRERRVLAERVADETSVGLAFALAVNPIPLLDFITGTSGMAIMVLRVAGVYGETPTRADAIALAKQMVREGTRAFWGSAATVLAGGAMKILPGLGHLAGALAQGGSAGYVAYILGRALVDYYENGHDWGEGGLKANLERLAASTDRKEITRGIVERLKARLGV